ncbi:MAG: sigma-70 family RNA polymerase sigma factor [Planctomycetes bacterium]|nr:sigma-70 family RNA polymerase sigma factor [Planctomycetota bacterium]
MDSQSGKDLNHLLAQARQGQNDALGRLLELYRNYVKLLADLQINRRLQGKVSASDIVQETFLQAKRGFTQFRGTSEGELVVWLRQILASQLAMLFRHYSTQKRDLHLEHQLDEELNHSSQALGFSLVSKQTSPSQNAIRREQSVLLADALARISADYREVIVLRHLEGMSFPDVAQRMGRSLAAVKNLWTRAISKLRDTLGEES